MKLKKILQDNNINLNEDKFEECLRINDTTSKELFDLIASSEEFNGVEKIINCEKEELKNCVTISINDSIKFLKNIKLNLIHFSDKNDKILVRLTRDSFDFKIEYSNYRIEERNYKNGKKLFFPQFVNDFKEWVDISLEGFLDKESAKEEVINYEGSKIEEKIIHQVYA